MIRELQRKRKCVDDVVGWANTLAELFWDAVEFFEVTGNHGIIQNLKKFCWGRRELEFVGFWLKSDGVKPTGETLKAITDFPRPTDITGIRSWFGLVEQVSFSFAKNELMEPFRALLKPKSQFQWDEPIQLAFDRAKVEIVKLVEGGVMLFVLGAWLCLVTDWSRVGVG